MSEKDLFLDTGTFRASMIVDTVNPYDEDKFIEMRLGPMLIRSVGPSVRCKATEVNYDKVDRNPEEEPNSTLSSYRMFKGKGVIFGMYY
jgi:uncharacterized protein YcbX